MIGLVLPAAPAGPPEGPRRWEFLLGAPVLPYLLARGGRCDQRRERPLGGRAGYSPAPLQAGASLPWLLAGSQRQAKLLVRAMLPAGLTAQHRTRLSRQAQ